MGTAKPLVTGVQRSGLPESVAEEAASLLRNLPANQFGDNGKWLRVELCISLKNLVNSSTPTWDAQSQQLYEQLVSLVIVTLNTILSSSAAQPQSSQLTAELRRVMHSRLTEYMIRDGKILMAVLNFLASEMIVGQNRSFGLMLAAVTAFLVKNADAESMEKLADALLVSLQILCKLSSQKIVADSLVSEGRLVVLLDTIKDASNSSDHWIALFDTVIEIVCTVGRCLGLYYHKLPMVCQSQGGTSAVPLIRRLVEAGQSLSPSLSAFRMTILRRTLTLLPECVIRTAYLDDFLDCQGPSMLVDSVLLAEMESFTAVEKCIDTLQDLVVRTGITKSSDDAGYWLQAPKNGTYECQAMVVDVFIQLLDGAKSARLAVKLVTALSNLFPERPLFGTSNAVSILSAIRGRFNSFDYRFQEVAISFTQAIMLREPTQWLYPEFKLCCDVALTSDASGSILIANYIRKMCEVTQYQSSVSTPVVVQGLMKLLCISQQRQPQDESFSNEWTSAVRAFLYCIDFVLDVDTTRGKDINSSGIACLLQLLEDSRVHEEASSALEKAAKWTTDPEQILHGLVSLLRRIAPTSTNVACELTEYEKLRSGNSSVDDTVIHSKWTRSEHSYIDLSKGLRNTADADLSTASTVDVNEATLDSTTCITVVKLLRNIMNNEPATKNTFLKVHGIDAIIGIICREPNVTESEAAINCGIASLALLAIVTSGSNAISYTADHFHRIFKASTRLDSADSFLLRFTIALLQGSMELPWSPSNTFEAFVDQVMPSALAADLTQLHEIIVPTGIAASGPSQINQRPRLLLYPSLIRIVMELVTVSSSSTKFQSDLTIAVLKDILSITTEATENIQIMSEAGLLGSFMNVFWEHFVDDSSAFHGTLVHMLAVLGQYAMNGAEVRQVTELMNVPNCPSTLIRAVNKLVELPHVQPRHYVDFASRIPPDDSSEKLIHGTESAGMLRFQMPHASWPPTGGLTTSMWMRYEDSTDQSVLKLFSLTSKEFDTDSDEIGISVSLDSRSGYITVNLGCNRQTNVVRTQSVMNCYKFSPGIWYHVIVSYTPLPSRILKKAEAEIWLYVDGVNWGKAMVPGFGWPRSSSVNCEIGTADVTGPTKWNLGVFFVLRQSILPTEAYLLYSMGPNVVGFRGNLPDCSYFECLSDDLIRGLGGHKSVFDLSVNNKSIGELSRKLMCYFRPQDFNVFVESNSSTVNPNESTPNVSNKHEMNSVTSVMDTRLGGGSVSASPQLSPEKSSDAAPRIASRKSAQPTLSPCTSTKLTWPARMCHRRGLQESMHELGGMHVLLYKLATTDPTETDQLGYLRLIFALLRFSPTNFRSMKDNEGYMMLGSFLRSDRCILGPATISVLLRGCAKDMRDPESSSDMIFSSRAIIFNTDLLKHVLLDWQIFAKAPATVWSNLYESLVSLVNPKTNAHAAFNAMQFRRVGAIKSILYTCEVEKRILPGKVAVSMLRLLHFLMNASDISDKQMLEDISSLMNFLVATQEYRSFRARQGAFTASPAVSASQSASRNKSSSSNEKLARSPVLSYNSDAFSSPSQSKQLRRMLSPKPLFPPSDDSEISISSAPPAKSTVGEDNDELKLTEMAIPAKTPTKETHSRLPEGPSTKWLSHTRKTPSEADLVLDKAFSIWWFDAENKQSDEDVSIRIGMFRLLQNQLYDCSASTFTGLQEIFSVKSLLALADNESEVVRLTVVRMIDYLLRMRGSFASQFHLSNGFTVLMNQLQQHQSSAELFAAVCNIFTGQTARASTFYENADIRADTELLIYRIVPVDLPQRERDVYIGQPECIQVLFALMLQAIGEPKLCTDMLGVLHDIFFHRKDLRNPMMSHGVVHVICDILASIDMDKKEAGSNSVSSAGSGEVENNQNVTTFSDEEREAVVLKASEFFTSITLFVCRIVKQEKGEGSGTKVIEDIVDYITNWGLCVDITELMQRVVLQSSLKQLFASIDSTSYFWKPWSVKPKNQTTHPAQRVCCMAIDIILYSPVSPEIVNSSDSEHDDDHSSFVCYTFNTAKILLLHGMVFSGDEAAIGTNLVYQFGRFLIHILEREQTHRILDFVVSTLASYPKLYEIVCRHLPLCHDILRALRDCYERFLAAQDDAICDRLISGIKTALDSQTNTKSFILSTNLDRKNNEPILNFSDVGRSKSWSDQYDEKRIAKNKERGIRKRVAALRRKEVMLKNGLGGVDVTSSTIEVQDKHKKNALKELQTTIERKARMQKRWRQLANEVTQPQAIWRNPAASMVWMLDPCEGPLRIRKRLCQAHLPPVSESLARSPVKEIQNAEDHTSVPSTIPGDAIEVSSDADNFDIPGVSELVPISTDTTGSDEDNEKENVHSLDISKFAQVLIKEVQQWLSQHLHDICDFDHPYQICRKLARDWQDGISGGLPASLISFTERIELMELVERSRDYLLQEFMENKKSSNSDAVSYITKQDTSSDNDTSSGLKPDERLVDVVGCQIVTPFNIKAGELLLGFHAFYFKEDTNQEVRGQSRAQPASVVALGTLSGDPGQLPSWPNNDIREVHDRRYLLQQNALEIFLTGGTALFFAFSDRRTRDSVRQTILSMELPNYVDYSNTVNGSLTRDSITSQWVKGTMSNFEYLMHVNKLAGRSFNDLTQYPVLPYVLKDYDSETLDLDNPASYRDLSKPMGAQDPDRLEKFLRRYKDLVDLDEEPYHYGSHYSSAGGVLHFLVRLEPFTQLFLELQGGKFDFADRTFCSIKQAWELSSKISTSDVKELIPEMFYLPEMFLNLNGCQFGVKQDGQVVDNVQLPPWAENSTRTFVYKHRQALESKHVSKQLNIWIDLIFGSKQTGEAAVQAANLFLPASYAGNVDIDAIEDPVEREAQWAIVRSFGQTPKQLLQRPHVVRDPRALGQSKQFIYSREGKAAEIVWSRKLSQAVYSLTISSDGVIGAGSSHQQVMADYGLAVLWGSWDNAISISMLESGKTVVQEPLDDTPVCVVTSRARRLVVSGGDTGLISIFRIGLRRDSRSDVKLHRLASLSGHSDSVESIVISVAFSVLLSGSVDGTVVIWDLNRFTFVRSLTAHEGPISYLGISDSTGDIATVCKCVRTPGVATRLHLWSINATLIATGDTDVEITSLLMSSITDGLNPNVVLTGMQDGSVMMWDMHDLKPMLVLLNPQFTSPVSTVHITSDLGTVIVGHDDGTINCWQKPSAKTERKLLASMVGWVANGVVTGVRGKDRTLQL